MILMVTVLRKENWKFFDFFFTYANFEIYIYFFISEAHHVPEHTLRGPRKYIFFVMKFVSIFEIY